MRLTYRPTTTEDLGSCVTLIQDEFAYDCKAKAHLTRFWRELLLGKCAESSVIEDSDRPPESRIVGFGLSLFVTDEFVLEVKSRPIPYLARYVLERWSQGRSPILTIEDIGRANAGSGLNSLVMPHGVREQILSEEEISRVSQQLIATFLELHRGYRLKELIKEVYGENGLHVLQRVGLRLLSDHGESFRTNVQPFPPPGRHPYLVGITREEALKEPGTFNFVLFSHSSPRFHFTPDQQELLRHALLGKTDVELCRMLNVALITVKKRWEFIYDRVVSVNPDLLPSMPADFSQDPRRGVEKRRCLLNYLRDHPEELKPFRPTRPGGARPSRRHPDAHSDRSLSSGN